MRISSIRGFLFDLDGTLFDSAPHMVACLNILLARHQKSPCILQTGRPWISHGVRFMLSQYFSVDEISELNLIYEFLTLYAQCIHLETEPYPGVSEFIEKLIRLQIPWGIVSNKPEQLIRKIIQHQSTVLNRPHCLIGGDTYSYSKPHPYPLQQACQLIGVEPQHAIYVGDAEGDVIAGKATGCKTAVALYGYLPLQEDPFAWRADFYLDTFIQLLDW